MLLLGILTSFWSGPTTSLVTILCSLVLFCLLYIPFVCYLFIMLKSMPCVVSYFSSWFWVLILSFKVKLLRESWLLCLVCRSLKFTKYNVLLTRLAVFWKFHNFFVVTVSFISLTAEKVNLAFPISLRCIYDFISLYITWTSFIDNFLW